jgi:hypothetical protein
LHSTDGNRHRIAECSDSLAVIDRQDDGLESSVSPLSQALPKRITYGARYRKGLPLSSALAESAVNEVVTLRMAKKQQTRWSDEGAHASVLVRVADLDGELSPRTFGDAPQPRQATVLRLWRDEVAMAA